jgi:hypothetical protein
MGYIIRMRVFSVVILLFLFVVGCSDVEEKPALLDEEPNEWNTIEVAFPLSEDFDLYNRENYKLINENEVVYTTFNQTKHKGSLLIYNFVTQKEEVIFDNLQYPEKIEYDSENHRLWIHTFDEKYHLTLLDLGTRQIIDKYTIDKHPWGEVIKVSPQYDWVLYHEEDKLWGYHLEKEKHVQFAEEAVEFLWNPDGQHFIYVDDISDAQGTITFVQVNVQTMEKESFTVNGFEHMVHLFNFQWFEPADSLYVETLDDQDQVSVHRIELRTGQAEVLAEDVFLGGMDYAYNPDKEQFLMSNQGEFSYYNRQGRLMNELSRWAGLDTVTQNTVNFFLKTNPEDLDSTMTTAIPSAMTVSPNKQFISYVGSGQTNRLIISDWDGENPRFVSEEGDYHVDSYDWSPDSKRLIVFFHKYIVDDGEWTQVPYLGITTPEIN